MRGVRDGAGFTLVEMVVVIAVVAVLFALLLPSLQRARELGLRVRCGSTLRQVGIGHFVYATDFRDWFRVFTKPTNFYAANAKLTTRLVSGALPDDYLNTVYPPTLRSCPTFPDKLATTNMDWYYQHPLLTLEFVQDGMGDRLEIPVTTTTATVPRYVRALKPGIGIHQGTGAVWTVYLKKWDVYGTLPLSSDMVGRTTGGTYSAFASAHNGGDPYQGQLITNGTANYLWFAGTNSVWEDGRVEWHDIGVEGYSNTWGGPTHVNYWDVALGTSGSGTARALHTRYDSTHNGYMWARRSGTVSAYP